MSWKCSKCTFQNSSATQSQCTVCGHNKNTSTQQSTSQPSDWQCSICGQHNSNSTHKCWSCFNEHESLFSSKNLDDELSEMMMAMKSNTVLSPSHSAPNPIASRYDDVVDVAHSAAADVGVDDDSTTHGGGSDTVGQSASTSSGAESARSSSLTRSHKCNSEIFDLYTNKKKSLLPIDINFITSVGRKPKLGAPSIKIHYDEDFNLSTSPSPSSTTHAPKQSHSHSHSHSHSRSLSYSRSQSQSHTLPMAMKGTHFFDKTDGFSSHSPTPPPPPPRISSLSQLSSSEAITVSQSLDLDTSPRGKTDGGGAQRTTRPRLRSRSNHQNAIHINVTSLSGSSVDSSVLLPLMPMQQMVRKYSDDPFDPNAATTTVLIAPHKNDDCGLKSVLQKVARMEHKLAQTVQQRHCNDAYYRRIVAKMRRQLRARHRNVLQETMMSCRSTAAVDEHHDDHADDDDDETSALQLLRCEGCQQSMTRAKCTDNNSHNHNQTVKIKCYQCKTGIGAHGVVEYYYHCPNVQLSLHRDIGRDLCALCGVQQMIRQDTRQVNNDDDDGDDDDDNMELDTDTDSDMMVEHDNFLHYATHKLEHILPVLSRITKLSHFERIYDALFAQTQQFGSRWQHDTDVVSLLRADATLLQRQTEKTRTELQSSKHNKLEIENEATQVSTELRQVDAEITSLMKRVTVLRGKKHDLQAQMHGLADVLHTMHEREQQLLDASAQTVRLEQKMRQRIQRMEAYHEKVCAVQHALQQQRRVLYGECDSWDTPHVLSQLQRYLSVNKVELHSAATVMHEIETRGITGTDLRNLNQLTLKMMNITDVRDHHVLLTWIASLTKNEQHACTTSTPAHTQHDENDAQEQPQTASTEMQTTTKSKEQLLCAICMHNRVNIILNPCGHICICHECSTKIKKICPVCRGHIDEIRNCFFASR